MANPPNAPEDYAVCVAYSPMTFTEEASSGSKQYYYVEKDDFRADMTVSDFIILVLNEIDMGSDDIAVQYNEKSLNPESVLEECEIFGEKEMVIFYTQNIPA